MNITNDQTMISAARSSSSRLLTMKKKNRTTMSSSSLFSLLPEEIIIDEILLNLPMNSLLKLRCVSRYFRCLITSRSFVKRHLDHNSTTDNAVLLITCRRDIGRYRSKEVFQHYSCNFSSSSSIVNDPSLPDPKIVEMPCPFESAGVYSSCNGLLFLHGTKEENKKHGYLWNPCTKEYKALPTPSIDEHLFGGIGQGISFSYSRNLSSTGFCGFSYDRTNDEYKILYHENRVGHHFRDDDRRGDLVSVTEFKLYTLGSDTWKNITADNPYRSLFFGSPREKRIGVLVNGALHWIMSSVPSSSSSSARNARIISFDMEKEEFRELQKPPYYSTRSPWEEHYYKELQVLQECLCLCQRPPFSINEFEIWMLKDYTVKDSWAKLFTVFLPNDGIKYIKLLRFWENEKIWITRDPRNKHLVVYLSIKSTSGIIDELTSRFVENIYELTQNRWTHEVIYIESLVSLNSGTYTIS